MSSKQHQYRLTHLVDELQHWVWQRAGERNTPSREEFKEFLQKHLDNMGLELQDAKAQMESMQIPALLKKKPDDAVSKRMRELAGIAHKGNFV